MRAFWFVSMLLISALASATPLRNIVVFGDSLSDNGNLYAYTKHQIPQSPPYFDGRFSNGPVWVERLANLYYGDNANEHLLDFAFGGAGISANRHEDILFTLERELDAYLVAHQGESLNDSLFVVWIGANNYLGVPQDPDKVVEMVNQGIQHGLVRLAKAGATHILVMNLPDLGNTPMAHDLQLEKELSYYGNEHNKKLASVVQRMQLQFPNTQWISYDTNDMFNKIISNPAQYGFKNTHDSCYNLTVSKPSNKSLLTMAASKVKLRAATVGCEGYLFFDSVHPTMATHDFMAETMKTLLEQSDIQFVD